MPSLLYPKKTSDGVPSGLQGLSRTLGLSIEFIREVYSLNAEERYRKPKPVEKKDGHRLIYDPIGKVRKIQGKINREIFNKIIEYPDYLYGSLPNEEREDGVFSRDYIACAQIHCGAKSLLKVDMSNFFGNIHRDYVFDIFNKFLKFDEESSEVLSDICCVDNSLPQGGLTSSYLAMLCFWDNEGELVKKLRRKGLFYTRLVDDITISSKIHGFNFDQAESYVNQMLLEKELPSNKNKRVVVRSGSSPLEVHGLRINFETPRLPSTEVRNIRAAVNNVVKLSKTNNYCTSLEYRRAYDRCMGRVNKLARVKHNQHEKLKNQLTSWSVLPKPSKLDLEKIERSLNFLEKHASTESGVDRRKLRKRFYLAQYRNSIISRTYVKESDVYRKRLNALRSFYTSGGDFDA